MNSAPGGAVEIRPAEARDVDALLRIEHAVFATDRLETRAFRHAVASPTIIALVAAQEGDVVGYVLVETRRNATVARLSSIAIAPKAGRSGLGRRLAEAAEDAVRARGCTRLRLEVRADNAGAIALYERTGYRRIGRERRYYEDGTSALRLEKTL